MYQVVYSKQALRTLRRMPRNDAERIMERLDRVATDPRAPDNNLKPLAGRPETRLRIGDWRVLFVLEDHLSRIDVRIIAPRGSAYR